MITVWPRYDHNTIPFSSPNFGLPVVIGGESGASRKSRICPLGLHSSDFLKAFQSVLKLSGWKQAPLKVPDKFNDELPLAAK